jgi:membrane-bound lytic murein transglycosylase B
MLPSAAMTRCPHPSRAWFKAVPPALTSAPVLTFVLALAGCATQVPPPTPKPTSTSAPAAKTATPTAPGMTPSDAIATPLPMPRPPSEEVRRAFVVETAVKYGLDETYIESVLARAQIRESTVAAMSRPAETKPWRDYRPIFITQQRIDGGRAFLAEHIATSSRASKRSTACRPK